MSENRIKSPKSSRKNSTLSPKVKPKVVQQNSNGSNTTAANRPLRLRIVLVGNEQIGKSCLIKRYCEKRFVSKYLPTIGIDYGATKIFVDKREVGIHIFDTSGNPLFYDVRNEFYRDAHGILLVFDVTDRTSFESMTKWLFEIFNEFALRTDPSSEKLHKPVILVCGNKIDLKQNSCENSVDDYEAKLWADLHGFTYCETSAMTGFGVGDMFHTFFSQIVKQQNELDRAGTLPRTPASARKVSSLSGSGSLNRRSIHAASLEPPELFSETTRPQPSPDQQAVMSRLGRGQNAWQQLGIEPGSSQEEVNKAYRKLAVLLHPDKTAVRGADEAFKLLGLARRTILNSLS